MSDFSNLNIFVVDLKIEHRDAVHGIGLTNVQEISSTDHAHHKMKIGSVPDLIIMEINMGGASGLNFMARIRAGNTPAHKNVPIIIMTRNLNPEMALRASEVGFEHFVRKPFTAESIQKRVTSVLQKNRRFVVGKAYFGPDRRDPNNTSVFEGEERRGVSGRVPSNSTLKAGDGGGKVAGNAAVSTDLPLVDTSPEVKPRAKSKEQIEAVAVSVEAKEQLKVAPKPPAQKPLTLKPSVESPSPEKPKEKAAAPKAEKLKSEIELANSPEKPKKEVEPDRAAEIAAKL
jgi:CheY-like chemotaxis protein